MLKFNKMKYRNKTIVDGIQFIDTSERLVEISDFVGDTISVDYSEEVPVLNIKNYYKSLSGNLEFLNSFYLTETDWLIKSQSPLTNTTHFTKIDDTSFKLNYEEL
jgi:hypothetical protein